MVYSAEGRPQAIAKMCAALDETQVRRMHMQMGSWCQGGCVPQPPPAAAAAACGLIARRCALRTDPID